jgi:hypothetical protein
MTTRGVNVADFTTVNPKSGGFHTGKSINDKMELGIHKLIYVAVGTGLLTTFTSNELHASGAYSELGKSGKFDISVTPDGSLFQVAVSITGDYADQSRKFAATATQADAHTVRLDQQGGDLSLTLKQNNGGFIEKSKIDITISWQSIGLYVQPT